MSEDKEKKHKTSLAVTIIVIIPLSLGATILAFLLLNGKTTTTEQPIESRTTRALVCQATGIDYPIFTYDQATRKEAKVNATFSNNGLGSMSFSYTMYYDDELSIIASEAHNHAAMNISFGHNGLTADAYNAKYSKNDDSMRMSLYVNKTDLSAIAMKYLMLDAKEDSEVPQTLEDYQARYQAQGFSCGIK